MYLICGWACVIKLQTSTNWISAAGHITGSKHYWSHHRVRSFRKCSNLDKPVKFSGELRLIMVSDASTSFRGANKPLIDQSNSFSQGNHGLIDKGVYISALIRTHSYLVSTELTYI